MNNSIILQHENAIDIQRLFNMGQAANEAATQNVFNEFRAEKTPATLKAHDNDLELFRLAMTDGNDMTMPDDLHINPEGWQFVTFGMLKIFKVWMLQNEYAISTINRALSTVRRYAKLAFEAGIVDETEHAKMKLVTGYSRKSAITINEKRSDAGMNTRRKIDRNGLKTKKKSEHVSLTIEQLNSLKSQSWVNLDDMTPQFYRDQLMMCLFLDHGLRCSELAGLTVGNVDLEAETITFYRPKIKETHTHQLETDALYAMKLWFAKGYAPDDPDAPLLRGSRKGGNLTDTPMSARAITKRVNVLGKQIGIDNLSAHDCRHSYATQLADNGASLNVLMQSGGWKTPSIAMDYIDKKKKRNEGAKLNAPALAQRELI